MRTVTVTLREERGLKRFNEDDQMLHITLPCYYFLYMMLVLKVCSCELS